MIQQNLIAPADYNIVDEIEKHSKDKIALWLCDEQGNEKKVTYGELVEKATKIANTFLAQGLQKGDVIIVMVPRSFEAYATYIGALKAGLSIIPSSEMLRAKDLDYRINHAEAKAVVAFSQFIDEINEANEISQLKLYVADKMETVSNWEPLFELAKDADVEFTGERTTADDIAFLAYTSGTTGNPKAAIHSHGWGYAHLRTTAEKWLGVENGDIVWATAAPGWQKWIWSPFLATLGSGATAFIYTGKFAPATYLANLQKYNINVLCCTPTEYRMMAKEQNLSDYNLSHLRSAVSAGEPLNREVIDTFEREFNVLVRDGYGQTENTLLIGTTLGVEPRPGSMGKPTPGNIVEVIDDFGNPVEPGVIGDIAVHKSTPALFKGYYKDPERTSMQFRGDWYITGDQAKKDEDGYFWFEGRGDDIIISSGYTIGPFEVEDALVKHAAVKECAVVASPDELRGAIVKAFIVLRDPAMKDDPNIVTELQEHVKELTAPYKYPRKIEFIDELPKTISGKIRRVELRKMEMSNA